MIKPRRVPTPRDDDEVHAAFADWLWYEIECLDIPQTEEEVRREMQLLENMPPVIIPTKTSDDHEVGEARRGNLEPLADLVRSHRDLLSDESYQIIEDLLRGRRPRRRDDGRPEKKMSLTPAKFAADLMDVALEIISSNFPDTARIQAEDAALNALSRKLDVEENTIMNLWRRPKRDRRRRSSW